MHAIHLNVSRAEVTLDSLNHLLDSFAVGDTSGNRKNMPASLPNQGNCLIEFCFSPSNYRDFRLCASQGLSHGSSKTTPPPVT